ncbi:glycosyltransferase 8 domain-containing protein 1-like isoform X2 [Oratosquilla oratoria]|uniref:glycosyltransferase 8 domain-containing protein 1-like isoform X2 n=1 Tax=Oratosquilla oratoria TaxID=337810 RepID=UPI003F764615
MGYTRIKIGLVVVGVSWTLFLFYIMSSLKWSPGSMGAARGPKHNLETSPHAGLFASSQFLEMANTFNSSGNTAKIAVTPRESAKSNFTPRKPKTSTEVKIINAKKAMLIAKISASANKINASANKVPGKVVQVVMAANSQTIMGLMAALNSIFLNSKVPVHFYLTFPGDVLKHFKEWLQNTNLNKLSHTARPFPREVPEDKPHFAKLFLTSIFPELEGIIIYIDTDVVVQGNIEEMTKIPIEKGHPGAFSEECTSVSRRFSRARPFYSTHVNLKHSAIRPLAIKPTECTFNTDVFVTNATTWKRENITGQLQQWLLHNQKEPIYGVEPELDESEAAMLLVFHNRISPIPQLWHVRDLGMTTGAGYSKQFVKKAKLLHWNGHFKPWARRAAFVEIWQKYYLPDVTLHYQPLRRHN